ncbi:hypothetical protein AKJ50_00590 [candidate division MSBL1 archaeon SCGC-AAA382A13]|uniref:SAM-dependent MTase RsmB/NOP-type domain-containing protein n=1 Tax=candidate division MSBL1 archaeon SCGC-AAA382A13 TaxID=1698279 RepID=A0A133VGL0_9EURY|nr:hypothetical protein AKJ50_00590 [candidate division MSBL1 archaeon SCGC-AAA382A13]
MNKMDRYKHIVPDFEEFKKIIQIGSPFDIRVNTIKSSAGEVKDFLKRCGLEFEQRGWNKNFLKLSDNPSKTLFHWLGNFYIQESVSGIPSLALAPESGDEVLDLCAAPGSKTTQISAMMGAEGVIVANDDKKNRVRSLLSNIYRMGCVNVKVTQKDGRDFPGSAEFDKIIVDVPCSAEGNARDQESLKNGANLENIKKLSNLQEQLLRKAFQLCKSGGTIVYSTCTFAPEENEFVVSKFLNRGKLIDPEFEFNHSKGITKWEGKKLDSEVSKCVRVYPHQLNSGGIFLAKFKKET